MTVIERFSQASSFLSGHYRKVVDIRAWDRLLIGRLMETLMMHERILLCESTLGFAAGQFRHRCNRRTALNGLPCAELAAQEKLHSPTTRGGVNPIAYVCHG